MPALQKRVQGGVPVGHPSVFWFVGHAGELLTGRAVARDGGPLRAPLRQAESGRWVSFGEQVYYRVRPTDADRNRGARWERGV
eukprot:3543253-Alexandrium_andersonii.AAC.1